MRMDDELNNYRVYLCSLEPWQILQHTYEFTIKQDIILAMGYVELTEENVDTLLSLKAPLEDIYKHYNRLETGYMEDIIWAIEIAAT